MQEFRRVKNNLTVGREHAALLGVPTTSSRPPLPLCCLPPCRRIVRPAAIACEKLLEQELY